jgi:hypothetical protein
MHERRWMTRMSEQQQLELSTRSQFGARMAALRVMRIVKLVDGGGEWRTSKCAWGLNGQQQWAERIAGAAGRSRKKSTRHEDGRRNRQQMHTNQRPQKKQ